MAARMRSRVRTVCAAERCMSPIASASTRNHLTGAGAFRLRYCSDALKRPPYPVLLLRFSKQLYHAVRATLCEITISSHPLAPIPAAHTTCRLPDNRELSPCCCPVPSLSFFSQAPEIKRLPGLEGRDSAHFLPLTGRIRERGRRQTTLHASCRSARVLERRGKFRNHRMTSMFDASDPDGAQPSARTASSASCNDAKIRPSPSAATMWCRCISDRR
jgi:hypothetical protein